MKLTESQQMTLTILQQFNDEEVTEAEAQKRLEKNGIHPDHAEAMLARQRGVSDLEEV